MKIICEECGLSFEFSAGEQQFYNSQGYDFPKRCKSCREKRKSSKNSKKYNIDLPHLGYKVSSFNENAQLFGMPINVIGGLSKEFDYVICAENTDEIKYVSWDEKVNRYKFVDIEGEATSYHWSSSLNELCNQLHQKYPHYSFTLKPQPYWLRLRYASDYPIEP